MLKRRETLTGLLASVLLIASLPAQQIAGHPLCGIVSIDTLEKTRAIVIVRAWREEPIEDELRQVRATLLNSLEQALRVATEEAAATGGPARGHRTGVLELQIGIGKPRNGVAPVGGAWLLRLQPFPDSSGYQPEILGWHVLGPLQLVAAESLMDGAKQEGLRLIAELSARHLKICRHLRDNPLSVGIQDRPPSPHMQPTGRKGR